MSFPQYERLKNSGLEWLGEVPEHWEVRRLRWVINCNPSRREVADHHRDLEVSFLPMEAIGEDGSLDLTHTRPISEVETGYTYFRNGDVVIAKITPCFENGKGAIVRNLIAGFGFGTTELIVVRPKAGLADATYLHWLFSSLPFRTMGEATMYGAGGQKRVPDEFVRGFTTPIPPIGEQSDIAAFLDHETAKIDKLVEEQERLIELLKKKRQAVISHAVTKGLGSNTPMKDSGLAWLGEVPAHWELKRLKHLAQNPCGVQMGPFGGMLKGLPTEPTGFKLYGQENTISGDFSRGGRWIEQARFRELERYALTQGDLVLTRKGSLGNCRAVPHNALPGIADSDTIRVRLNINLITLAFGLLLLQEADYIAGQIETNKRGAILSGLNTEVVSNLIVIVPPADEQSAIMNFANEQANAVKALIDDAQAAIGLLGERRTALISAAVTGKIDVRCPGASAAATVSKELDYADL